MHIHVCPGCQLEASCTWLVISSMPTNMHVTEETVCYEEDVTCSHHAVDSGYFCYPSVPWEWCPGRGAPWKPIELGFRKQEGGMGEEMCLGLRPLPPHTDSTPGRNKEPTCQQSQFQKLPISSPGHVFDERKRRDQTLTVEPEQFFKLLGGLKMYNGELLLLFLS